MSRIYDSRKRILVTGGAGFLGSHLIDRLLNRGHEVLCVDNLFTGTKRNIDHLHNHSRFEFLRHDITFPLFVEVDEIYNLACPASPIHYQHDPVQTTKTSRTRRDQHAGAGQAAQAPDLPGLDQRGLWRPSVHPQSESYWGNVNPIGPRSCYDEGKRCAETLFFDYYREYGLHIKVARIFNTYGPRMHPATAGWCRTSSSRRSKGEPITLYGDGSQTRSFCYVDDLIEGFVRLMDSRSGFHRAGQSRQSGRIHHPCPGRESPRRHRFPLGARIPSAARRRPEAAPARHNTRTRQAWLGSDSSIGGGARANNRVFPSYPCVTVGRVRLAGLRATSVLTSSQLKARRLIGAALA